MPSLIEHWLRHVNTIRTSYPFLTESDDPTPIRKYNPAGQMHCETGPAYISQTHCVWYINGRKHGPMVDKWGSRVYYFRNVLVPPKFWTDPESLTVDQVLRYPNAEHRYVGLEIYGFQRMLDEKQFKIIHEDDRTGAKLLQYTFKEQEDARRNRLEPLTVVCVINSTPEPDGHYKRYFLNVPPDMKTCQQAVAWTFGKEENTYKPQIET